MSAELHVEGEVSKRLQLTLDDLRSFESQVDMGTVDAKRAGQKAVRLSDILSRSGVADSATHLGLHGTHDDFHASVPLSPVIERGLVVYEHEGQPLTIDAGGPFRFFIPDHSACRVDEIDECANVKFLDRIELTSGRGFDNRPQDEDEHEQLHKRQADG